MPPKARRASLAAALIAPVALAAAFSQAVAVPAPAADVAVTIRDFDFHPMAVTVPVGAAVTWTNLDGEPHTITSLDGAVRSGALDQNERFSFRFTRPGVYRYVCSIHPRMTATVTVK